MISLLAKIFIKNNKDYSDSKVREQYGVLCGVVGIFLNILLSLGKCIFGLITSSVAMIADGLNNISDAASSVIQILGFKLSTKKPDTEHPFGHGRIEYISGLIISFLVLLMGFELFKKSIESIFHPQKPNISFTSIIVIIIAIIIKLYMLIYNNNIAKKINSVAMKTTSLDSFFDAISSSVVLISIILSQFTDLPVDGIAGFIVSLFILYGGFSSAKETIEPLLGTPASSEFVQEIENELKNHKIIIGMHDLIVHDYGPGRKMISLHAEVPGDKDIFELHDIIDNAEVEISQKFNCQVIIHMDPLDTKNERLNELKLIVKTECEKINSNLHCHDVRMVPGITHTNLIFDIVKPFDIKSSDEELKKTLSLAIKSHCNDVNCVITVDQPYS